MSTKPSVVGKERGSVIFGIVQGQDGRRISFIAATPKFGMKSLG
jgi:hypothetical protein